MSGISKHNKKNNKVSPKTVKKAKKAAATLQNVAQQVRIKGRGDYRPTAFARVKGKGDYASTGRDIGSAIGGTLGGIGDVASSLISGFRAITGMGDYRSHGPKSNSLYTSAKSQQAMTMGAMNAKFGNGGPPRVQHREFIGPVLAGGTVGFYTTPYRIQPGLSGVGVVFPWLNSLAGCFQQYVLHGAIFEYVSTSTDYSSSVALGTVSMSTLYDVNQTPLSTQLEVDNNEFTTFDKPSQSFIHPIECADKDNPTTVRFVRTSNSAATLSDSDDRLDDVGILQVSVNGNNAAAGTQLGELWVTYDIAFLKPSLPDVHAGTSYMATWKNISTTGAALPQPTSVNAGNSLPITFVAGTPNRVFLPVGYNGSFSLSLDSASTAATLTAGPQLGGVGTDVTPLSLYPATASTFTAGGTKMAAYGFNYTFYFSTIASNASQNWIDILTPFGVYSSATSVNLVMTLMAIDNDIVPFTAYDDMFDLFGKMASGRLSQSDKIRLADHLNTNIPHDPQPNPNEEMKEDEMYLRTDESLSGVSTPALQADPLSASTLDVLRRVLARN